MLNDKQIQAIEYLALGELTRKEISNKIGISDRQLYRWQNDEEFQAEWRKRSSVIQKSMEQEGKARMTAKGQVAIDNIFRLANESGSDNVKLDANKFIYESIFGRATSKIADVTDDEDKDKIDHNELQDELNKFKTIQESQEDEENDSDNDQQRTA